jgi:hypothetical protein
MFTDDAVERDVGGGDIVLTTCDALEAARTALAMPEDEPDAFVEVVDSYEGPYNFHGQSLLTVGLHSLYTSPQPAPSVPDIKTLVDRFLTWKLPDTFAPDAGISFKAPDERWWPTGTNLFMATEAEEMLRHVLAAAPEVKS